MASSSVKPDAPVSYQDVLDAYERLKPLVVRTPVLTCPELDKACGHSVFLKCESLQRTGSFKFRGASNALSQLPASTAVVTHSSGNHGAAVAAAAAAQNRKAVVVVPRTTPSVKLQNITSYGASVVLCEPTSTARAEAAQREADKLGDAAIIHPYNQREVIAGQGTLALELLEEVPDLDAVLVPVSGGGMLTGIATAVRGKRPDGSCHVHAVEPKGKRLGEALKQGNRVVDPDLVNLPLDTICDAIRLRPIGDLAWTLAYDHSLVDPHVLSVEDKEVLTAMKFIFEKLKLVVEPAAATSIAALLGGQLPSNRDRPLRVGVVLCGGNVDLDSGFPWQTHGSEAGEEPSTKRQKA